MSTNAPIPATRTASTTPAASTTFATPIVPPPASTDTTLLPDDPTVLKQMIAELLRELRRERRDREGVQQRLDALLRRLYGPRPTADNPQQPSLFPLLDSDTTESPEPPQTPDSSLPGQTVGRRGRNQSHGRRQPPNHLRRESRRYELSEAERSCPECGQERREIGVETSEQYDYKPAEVFVIEHQQVKYACACCQGQVCQALKPPQPIDKGLPGPGLLAQIIADKYLDHLPLYRTEKRLARLGAPLSRSTMCDWMAACANLLTPLWQLLKQHILQSKVDYTTTHARDGPAAFLKGFTGYLQADAYGAYDQG